MDNVNGFYVSDKRKAVWNAEIALLEVFKSICKKNNLQYFAIGGTLLGAARHKGFIPWDDDIDLAMFRDEYEIFLGIAKTELPEGVFLQVADTDVDFFLGHAKLRLNHTTAIRRDQYSKKHLCHQGIFIDIFPMDNIPANKCFHRIHKFIAVTIQNAIGYAKYYCQADNQSLKAKIKYKICTFFLHSNDILKKMTHFWERWIKLSNQKESDMVGLISQFYEQENRFSWKKEWFKNSMIMPFENTQVTVPCDYDKILTKCYGDYMTPERVPSEHGLVFFDLENDYKEYLRGERCFYKDDLIL